MLLGVNVKNMRIEDERPEVMLPIERAVLTMYTVQPDLTDADVDAALGSLITHYRAQERGLTPQHRLTERQQNLFELMLREADGLLGAGDVDLPLLTRAVTRLRKSVSFWTKRGGRQGYLNYVQSML